MDHNRQTVLNLRGVRCPHVVLRAKKALRSLAIGDELVLECTDPLAMIDVPAFVNQTRHRLSDQAQNDEIFIFKIVKLH